mgnify:CR=1 FL=1
MADREHNYAQLRMALSREFKGHAEIRKLIKGQRLRDNLDAAAAAYELLLSGLADGGAGLGQHGAKLGCRKRPLHRRRAVCPTAEQRLPGLGQHGLG